MSRLSTVGVTVVLAAVGALAGACAGNVADPDGSENRAALAAECGADQPARGLSAAQRDTLAARLGTTVGASPPLEFRAQLARDLPGGFAGVFKDGTTERFIVLFVDPAAGRAALPELARRLNADLLGQCHGACGDVPHIDLRRAEVRPARWDYAQLHDWYRLREPALWAPPGVGTVGIGEARNRIFVGVEDEAARQRAEAHYAGLGLPCGLLHVEVVGRAAAF
jgi:hypothetical protein